MNFIIAGKSSADILDKSICKSVLKITEDWEKVVELYVRKKPKWIPKFVWIRLIKLVLVEVGWPMTKRDKGAEFKKEVDFAFYKKSFERLEEIMLLIQKGQYENGEHLDREGMRSFATNILAEIDVFAADAAGELGG